MKITICSTLTAAPWGGSEELWSRAAANLLRRGHEVSVSYPYQRALPPQLEPLRQLGAQLIHCPKPAKRRWFRRGLRQRAITSLERSLHVNKPDLMLISISWHLDDPSITQICRHAGIPYCLLIQSASSNFFLDGSHWDAHREAFAGATKCFFVSEQNRDLMEANIGLDLSQSRIVDNSFCVNTDAVPSWPSCDRPWRLACVGRIDFQSKGQDVLLQTLRHPRWRHRPLQVTLFGADCGNERQVKALIDLYGLGDQVRLGGFVDDIAHVWRDHHGLVLPSRAEGNALALVEAMMCGRVPIVTNVGRAAVLVDDNVSGFVAPGATVDSLDDALERAWQRRHMWRQIGDAAAVTIRERHSLRPAEEFAEMILVVGRGRPRAETRAA